MLALERPGHRDLAIARTLRVGIAADDTSDAGAVAPAAAHADHEVDLFARAHAPAINIAGDGKHGSFFRQACWSGAPYIPEQGQSLEHAAQLLLVGSRLV